MHIEGLERRLLLSGVVNAKLSDGVLQLRGDSANNVLSLSRSSDGASLEVIGGDDTLVNGRDRAAFRLSSLRGIDLDLGEGNDTLTISNVRLRGPVQFSLGEGADQLIIRKSRFAGDVAILGGEGADHLTLRDSIVQGQLRVEGQTGRDQYTFSRVLVKRSFNLRDLSGGSVLNLNRLSVRGDAGIRLGTSYDDVTLDSSTFFGQSLLALGLGADRATIRGSVFHGASTLPHPDDWDDDVHREILLGWDFNDGMQGWTTGFANYPKGQVVGTDANGRPVLAEEAYILDAGIKTLPPELGANSRGISFTFRNNSDELQSFATTKLEALAGVAASRKYRLYVEVVLSTNLPSNPGTILHAYVGAAPEAPVVARSPDDQHAPFQHRINNLDLGVYGYFNRPGEDGSFAGFVNNGLPDEQIAWGTTRISHTHSTVQSSEGGKLHPIIMVHSTFETTQHFYIHSTRIRLVPL